MTALPSEKALERACDYLDLVVPDDETPTHWVRELSEANYWRVISLARFLDRETEPLSRELAAWRDLEEIFTDLINAADERFAVDDPYRDLILAARAALTRVQQL
jgi:hypothetical protein